MPAVNVKYALMQHWLTSPMQLVSKICLKCALTILQNKKLF